MFSLFCGWICSSLCLLLPKNEAWQLNVTCGRKKGNHKIYWSNQCEWKRWFTQTSNAACSRSWEGSRQNASPRKVRRTWKTSDQWPTVSTSTSKAPSRSPTVCSRASVPVCRCWSSVQNENKKSYTIMLKGLLRPQQYHFWMMWYLLVFWVVFWHHL